MLAIGVSPVPVAGCEVCAPPDTLVQVWVPPATATAGGRVHVRVQIAVEGADLALGSVAGRIRFEPALLAYEEVLTGEEGGELVVDDAEAAGGSVSFSLVRDPAGEPVRRTTVLEVRFLVTGPPGGRADVVLELGEIDSAPVGEGSGSDVLPWTVVRNGVVLIL